MIKDKLPIKLNIPDEFFLEEVRCDYTISSKMKKIWAVELDLLNEFQRVCQKHHIRYFANGGTLLGAARHQGFIPWDDDLDVMMLREDYEHFCEITPDEFQHPYFLQTQQTDKGYINGFARLRNSMTTGITGFEQCVKIPTNHGIFIDIFPVNCLPADESQIEPFLDKVKKLKFKGVYTFLGQYNIFKYYRLTRKRFFKLLWLKMYAWYHVKFRGRTWNSWYEEYERYAYQYTNNPESTKVIVEPFYRKKCILDLKDFDRTVDLPFEMLTIPAPIGWENYLRINFGDWHKFVKGGSMHYDVKFDPEKPYNEK